MIRKESLVQSIFLVYFFSRKVKISLNPSGFARSGICDSRLAKAPRTPSRRASGGPVSFFSSSLDVAKASTSHAWSSQLSEGKPLNQGYSWTSSSSFGTNMARSVQNGLNISISDDSEIIDLTNNRNADSVWSQSLPSA